MYTSYNAYNLCNICQPVYLGEKIEIIRQQTADLREKMKFFEGHISNEDPSVPPISTTLNNNLESAMDKIYPCNYCPQVYPIPVPSYYPQYDPMELMASPPLLDPVFFSSQEPNSLRNEYEAAVIQSAEKQGLDTANTENGRSKADTLQLNDTDSPMKINNGNQFYSDASSTSQGEFKEMLQLCLTLINDLRDARTELTTILNKCLEGHSKFDKELLSQLCCIKDEKSCVGKKSRHSSEDKGKILNEMSKEQRANSYTPIDKKMNKAIKGEKFTEKQKLDGNENSKEDTALTILINCLEAIKMSQEDYVNPEDMHMLGRTVKIESNCKCIGNKKKSNHFETETINKSSCFCHKPTHSKCLCLHQAAAASPLLLVESHALQSKPFTCRCNIPFNELQEMNYSIAKAEQDNFTEAHSTIENELVEVTKFPRETENKSKNIKSDEKLKEKYNERGDKEKEENVHDKAKEKIKETEKLESIVNSERRSSGEIVTILPKDTCSCPANKSEAKSDNVTKSVTLQEYSGGCCCSGERQQLCKCGPYLDPPCGREAITVTRKCTNKPPKGVKEVKPWKTKSKRNNRPCFHTWPERTKCLKRCINHSCP